MREAAAFPPIQRQPQALFQPDLRLVAKKLARTRYVRQAVPYVSDTRILIFSFDAGSSGNLL
jgi:hypothetical protein